MNVNVRVLAGSCLRTRSFELRWVSLRREDEQWMVSVETVVGWEVVTVMSTELSNLIIDCCSRSWWRLSDWTDEHLYRA